MLLLSMPANNYGYLRHLSVRTPLNDMCASGIPALTILKLCYSSTYALIRRGLGNDIVSGHIHVAIRELIKFARASGQDWSQVSLQNICIPVELYSTIFTVQWTMVFTESVLSDMLMSISNSVFAISNSANVPPAPTAEQEFERESHWNSIEGELKKPMQVINFSKISYPLTSKHSHDPKHSTACAMWNKHKTASTKTVLAEKGLRQVLLIVIRLLEIGCDSNRSWQLIRHYTALVHLGIRCERVEGLNLLVPDKFLRDYWAASIRIMKSAMDDKLMTERTAMPEAFFDTAYGFVYKRLATFSSWGQSDAFFSSDVTIKNMMSYASHTVTENIKVADQLYAPFVNVSTTRQLSTSVRTLKPDCQTSLNTNDNLSCVTAEKYCYMATAGNAGKHWYANCCNVVICQNAITIIPEITDFEGCCTECNQLECSPALSNNEELTVPNSYSEEDVVVHVYF